MWFFLLWALGGMLGALLGWSAESPDLTFIAIIVLSTLGAIVGTLIDDFEDGFK